MGRHAAPVPSDEPASVADVRVVSGEPTPDGLVLWTRLATDPLAPDGLGGIGTRRTDVEWELATDANFRRVERRGITPTVGPPASRAALPTAPIIATEPPPVTSTCPRPPMADPTDAARSR